MIKRLLFFLTMFLLLANTFDGLAQAPCVPCKDSLKQENIFFTCFGEYIPVCACDGNTYRNACFAENKYAIRTGCYQQGPCGVFDVDISPNIVGGFSPLSSNYGLTFQVHAKKRGFLIVNVFTPMGRFQLQKVFPLAENLPGITPQAYTINTSTWDQGVFILEFFFEGERVIKKVFKQPDL